MTLTLQSVLYTLLVFVLFYLIRRRFRVALLALASLGYVCLLDIHAGIAVVVIAVITWAWGLMIASPRVNSSKRLPGVITAAGITLLALFLLFMKSYTRFSFMQDTDSILHRFILPIGFSFYVFQAISYLADVHRQIIPAEHNVFRMFIYLAWFPKFVSGPIERKQDMDAQLVNVQDLRFFDAARWSCVIHYILIGAFYKIVIADRLGIYVDMIYGAYEGMNSLTLFIGMILYSFQIYCDFAGYSYAAIGFSLVFGIRLSENFRLPYMSRNITEFWRRWHCSLSSWLRDYIYIPLGGNRHGRVRKAINTMIVFLICGIWHGEKISFVAWGLLHGFFSVIDGLPFFREGRGHRLREGWLGRILTFLCVSFAWLFFRASSFKGAVRYILTMLTAGVSKSTLASDHMALFPDKITDIYIIVISLLVMLVVEYISYRKEINVPALIIGRPFYVQYAVAFLLIMGIMILGVYGPANDTAQMIYMQF